MHIQVYLKVVGALVEVMLRLGHKRLVIVFVKQPHLLQSFITTSLTKNLAATPVLDC